MSRPFYAGLIEVPEGKSTCVSCGRIVDAGIITCPSCAEKLGKRMNPPDETRPDRRGRY